MAPQRNQRGVTSSRNRSTRSSSKPVTGSKPSNRTNRQAASKAPVTQSGGGGRGGARVTNASQRTTSGSARVTGGARPALPPGRQGGAIVRQETKPENPRRTSARSRQATASRGTTGPSRVGQPAGSANRMYGANVVNRSVNRAVTGARMAGLGKLAGRAALPVAIGTQLMDVAGGFQKLANHPFLKGNKSSKPAPSAGRRTNPKAATPSKPKPNMDRPGLRYEKMTDTRAPRSAYGLKDKPSSGTTRASAPSRSSSTSAPARTPSRSSAPARSAAASRPAASSTPKAPKVAETSGIGPVKSGTEYARKKGSISETTRQLREMRKRSEERQKKGK